MEDAVMPNGLTDARLAATESKIHKLDNQPQQQPSQSHKQTDNKQVKDTRKPQKQTETTDSKISTVQQDIQHSQ
jgi:hypothetical protein